MLAPSPFLITSEAEHQRQHYTSFKHQFLLVIIISMSCCGGNCGCGGGCGGCKMFPDVEAASSTTTMVIAAATNKASSGGFEAAAEAGGCDCNTCKCGTSCGCSCCSCN